MLHYVFQNDAAVCDIPITNVAVFSIEILNAQVIV